MRGAKADLLLKCFGYKWAIGYRPMLKDLLVVF